MNRCSICGKPSTTSHVCEARSTPYEFATTGDIDMGTHRVVTVPRRPMFVEATRRVENGIEFITMRASR